MLYGKVVRRNRSLNALRSYWYISSASVERSFFKMIKSYLRTFIWQLTGTRFYYLVFCSIHFSVITLLVCIFEFEKVTKYICIHKSYSNWAYPKCRSTSSRFCVRAIAINHCSRQPAVENEQTFLIYLSFRQ